MKNAKISSSQIINPHLVLGGGGDDPINDGKNKKKKKQTESLLQTLALMLRALF